MVPAVGYKSEVTVSGVRNLGAISTNKTSIYEWCNRHVLGWICDLCHVAGFRGIHAMLTSCCDNLQQGMAPSMYMLQVWSNKTLCAYSVAMLHQRHKG